MIENNINNIYEFSNILHNINITELSYPLKCLAESNVNLLYMIKAYESYVCVNDFSHLACPSCGYSEHLHYHKSYDRNLIFYFNQYKIEAKIALAVLKCSYCSKKKNNPQKYHTIIPEFIFPYHIYSADTIIKTLYNNIINKIKLNQLMESLKISHQLFYQWVKGIHSYIMPSSVILQVKADIIAIVKSIYKFNYSFLLGFYNTYNHPFFLFKPTCVPLSITP